MCVPRKYQVALDTKWQGILLTATLGSGCALSKPFGKLHENPEHTAWYSIGTLTELVRRFGFVVEDARYGSSKGFLWRAFFLPPILRHTSIWVVTRLRGPADSLGAEELGK